MKRSERILRLPSLEISLQTADRILEILHEVAQSRIDKEAEQRLRTVYGQDSGPALKEDPASTTVDLFVSRHLRDPKLLAMMKLPSYERYVFTSRAENVEFRDPQFELKELPSDVQSAYIKVEGIERFIEIKLNANFANFNQITDQGANQILIQGEEPAWVSGTYHRIDQLIRLERKQIRTLIYRYARPIFWLLVVLVWTSEYSVVSWANPGFKISAPLSGTGAIVLFGVLLGTVLALANLIIPMYCFWFPYFEFEGNISRPRLASRKFIAGIVTAIFTGAVINTIHLLFAGLIHRATGH